MVIPLGGRWAGCERGGGGAKEGWNVSELCISKVIRYKKVFTDYSFQKAMSHEGINVMSGVEVNVFK